MRLFEAIIAANHEAAAGNPNAGLRPADYAAELPIVALTCIDPRLNPLLPQALGVPAEEFIWLRNAGNIITSPLSSTMRSLALACAVKGGKEIAIIGHTDCQISKTTAFSVLDSLSRMGVNRGALPDNASDFFGIFSSERANVLKAVAFVRASPLIGSSIPVHGLVIDTDTGRLDWIVNGYDSFAQNVTHTLEPLGNALGQAADMLKGLKDFNLGEMKLPDIKIGDLESKIEDLANIKHPVLEHPQAPPQPQVPPPIPPTPPPKLPLPRPTKPSLFLRRSPK